MRNRKILQNLLILGVLGLSVVQNVWAASGDPDLNNDGVVDITDISIVGNCFGLNVSTTPVCSVADVDGNGIVDMADFNAVIAHYGETGFPTDDIDVTPPQITINTPDNLQLFNTSPIQVSGIIDDEKASVVINGVDAIVSSGSPSTFTAQIPIKEGNTLITAVAADAADNTATASIQVTLDTDPPTVTVESPQDGAILSTPAVDVLGQINDIITGTTINADDCQVSVNGIEASVVNRNFVVENLPLTPGPNLLTVQAQDQAGNQAEISLQVMVQNLAGQRIIEVAGNGQTAVVGTQLSEPLAIQLLDADNVPVAGRQVQFDVSRGDGRVSAGSGEGTRVFVTTDASGQASVFYTLGSRIGTSNHRVIATAQGFVGQAEFYAKAINSPAARITSTAGDGQVGSAGESLPRPLIVLVTDGQGNPVGGVDVVFGVLRGGGTIDGVPSIQKTTDLDGLVSAVLTLGSQEGINNNVVTATFDTGSDILSTSFIASGRIAGAPEDTTVSGVVLDNQDIPVPGVTAHLEVPGAVADPVLTAVTDEDGSFSISNAPVGTVRLRVDGSTTSLPGRWPVVEFDFTTIAGQDNTVGMPIYLPKLAENEVIVPDGGPDQDVTISISEIPGAELTLTANSVSCPDGQSQCRVSWSQVNAGRVPMAPPMGSGFMLAWTIQPAGAHFDPPAAICIPNSDQPPGQQVEMFSFDHDLGEFVAVGTATITEDGSQICSDPGFGIVKAGWGGCVPPPEDETCVDGCGICKTCDTNQGACVADDSQTPPGLTVEANISGEIATATSLVENAVKGIPFVSDPSVTGELSGNSSPVCCAGEPKNPGSITYGGSLTASATISKTIGVEFGPFESPPFNVFGVGELIAFIELDLGPTVSGAPSVTISAGGANNLCTGENCFSVDGCGEVTVTAGVNAVAEVGALRNGEDFIQIGINATATADSTAAGKVSHSSCSGSNASGCLGDLRGDVGVKAFGLTIFNVEDFLLVKAQGECSCGIL